MLLFVGVRGLLIAVASLVEGALGRMGSSSCGSWAVAAAVAAQSLQSCPTLCDPIDGSPPGSSVPGILQARTLEWVAISFSMWAVEDRLIVVAHWLSCSTTHGIFPNQGSLNLCLLHWQAILYY